MSERLTSAEIDAMERNIQPYTMHRYSDEGVPVHTLTARRCLSADQSLSLIGDLRATRAELAELRGVVREAVAALREQHHILDLARYKALWMTEHHEYNMDGFRREREAEATLGIEDERRRADRLEACYLAIRALVAAAEEATDV